MVKSRVILKPSAIKGYYDQPDTLFEMNRVNGVLNNAKEAEGFVQDILIGLGFYIAHTIKGSTLDEGKVDEVIAVEFQFPDGTVDWNWQELRNLIEVDTNV